MALLSGALKLWFCEVSWPLAKNPWTLRSTTLVLQGDVWVAGTEDGLFFRQQERRRLLASLYVFP